MRKMLKGVHMRFLSILSTLHQRCSKILIRCSLRCSSINTIYIYIIIKMLIDAHLCVMGGSLATNGMSRAKEGAK